MHKVDDQVIRIDVKHFRACPVDERGCDSEGGGRQNRQNVGYEVRNGPVVDGRDVAVLVVVQVRNDEDGSLLLHLVELDPQVGEDVKEEAEELKEGQLPVQLEVRLVDQRDF